MANRGHCLRLLVLGALVRARVVHRSVLVLSLALIAIVVVALQVMMVVQSLTGRRVMHILIQLSAVLVQPLEASNTECVARRTVVEGRVVGHRGDRIRRVVRVIEAVRAEAIARVVLLQEAGGTASVVRP